MKLAIYQVLHVASMVLLASFTFQSFANPDPKNRKRSAMITGILSLLMLVGGFGLVAVLKVGFPWWVLVKLVCWLGLSALGGLAFRKPARIPMLRSTVIALVVLAISTVYFRNLVTGSHE
jgi:hypothetical protein